jgi:hypothetical protein
MRLGRSGRGPSKVDMARARLGSFVVLGVVLAWGGPALAGPGAALVEVAAEGSWTAREQVDLHMTVSRTLTGAGLQLVGPEQVEIALAGRSASSCRDDRCRIDLARNLDVGRLIFAHLRAESGGVTVTFVLFNAEVGERTGSASRFARGDDPAALREAITHAATSMLKAELPMPAARLSVRTRPSGAGITVDGRPLGEGDAELPVTAGRHVVVLERPGFTRAKVRVDVKPGEVATLDVTLVRAAGGALVGAASGPATETDRAAARPWRTAGYVVVGSGIVALATGIGLYAYGCTPAAGAARCPVQASVRSSGRALMGVGGALVFVGVGVWVYDLWRARARARVSLGPGGAALAFDW